MKTIILSFIILIAFSLKAQNPTKVLFIGNSITYFNDMPQTFENIANSFGDLTEVTMYAPGGTGFVNHVDDPNVYEVFRAGDWDFIVLQPGSNESPGYSYPIEETLTRAEILLDSIYTYNPCTKVLYYEISYGVWGSTPENLATYNETMDLIHTNLNFLADNTLTFYAPVGEAISTAWNNDQSNMLWGSTGDIHPNTKGSYIAACVFYASIFQKNSLGTTIINDLPFEEAANYQLLADTIVLNHLSDWRINVYNQTVNFDYAINYSEVEFTNLSQNYDSVFWSFGDGSSTSSDPNPIHLYSAGNYTVVQTSYFHGCVIDAAKDFTIEDFSFTEQVISDKIGIYPNPAIEEFRLDIANGFDIDELMIRITDITGKVIINESLTTSSNQNISTKNWPKGLYSVCLIGKDKIIETTRLIVQ